jgi:EAL domain-containing protein (putative c-di-GMP-specific phosphodiesterase class I)
MTTGSIDGKGDGWLRILTYKTTEGSMRRTMSSQSVRSLKNCTTAASAVRTEAQIVHELHAALEGDDLAVYYQPIVDARIGRVIAMEALIRWRHPQWDFVPPDVFIPIAEKTGLIHRIGDLVLRRACSDAATWPAHMRVAVNLSPSELRQKDLTKKICRALDETGLPTRRLEIEISERTLLSLNAAATSTLNSVSSLGVRLALDDFGTGFSNLNYLNYFPVDTVKIDKCFCALALESFKTRAIMRMMSKLAEELGVELIAEGVETTDQLRLLSLENITLIQGFLFSRARPIEELAPLLHDDAVALIPPARPELKRA